MRRSTTTLLTLLCLARPVAAETPAEGALARFDACLASETGDSLDAQTREGLQALSGDAGAALSAACGAECDSFEALSCEQVAQAWAQAMGVAAPLAAVNDLPDWARAFATAVVDRVTICFEAETGDEPSVAEREAIEAYQVTLAGALVSLTDSLGCTIHDEGAAACAGAVRSTACDELAGGLFDGAGALASGSGDACATMFECDLGADDAEIDALFEREIGGPNGGR